MHVVGEGDERLGCGEDRSGLRWEQRGWEGEGGCRRGVTVCGTDVLLCLVHVAWVHNDM